MATWMELNEEEGGPRYYVNGVPMHAGDGLEVKIGGKWIAGHYEYSWPGRGYPLKPLFYYGDAEAVHLLDPIRDRVRLPGEGS